MQHAPVKSADGKMVLARQANLPPPTSAGDIRKKLQEGTFLFGYLLQLSNVGIIIAVSLLLCAIRMGMEQKNVDQPLPLTPSSHSILVNLCRFPQLIATGLKEQLIPRTEVILAFRMAFRDSIAITSSSA